MRISDWSSDVCSSDLFAAGQFARLTFGGLPARAYSMASMPGEEVLEFHIRLIPGGRVSTHIADSLKVGDSAQIEGPYGSPHLRPDDDGPVVLIAGRSEEHTSELQSLILSSYAIFCLNKKKT